MQLEPQIRNKLIYFTKDELVNLCQRGVADMVRLVGNKQLVLHENLQLIQADI